jgi:hypothetical protein
MTLRDRHDFVCECHRLKRAGVGPHDIAHMLNITVGLVREFLSEPPPSVRRDTATHALDQMFEPSGRPVDRDGA